ncbi:MAG: hypothetical protein QXS29_10095 [Nitrososphaeria archaeon]
MKRPGIEALCIISLTYLLLIIVLDKNTESQKIVGGIVANLVSGHLGYLNAQIERETN